VNTYPCRSCLRSMSAIQAGSAFAPLKIPSSSVLSRFLSIIIHLNRPIAYEHVGMKCNECAVGVQWCHTLKAVSLLCALTIPPYHPDARRRGCGTFVTAPLLLNRPIAC